MDNNRVGVGIGGRWGGLEGWAGVGEKGRKLYLNNNKIFKKRKKHLKN